MAVIHTAVNSSATIAAQQLKEARKEIADLRVYIAEQSPPAAKPLPGRATPDITVDPNDPPDA